MMRIRPSRTSSVVHRPERRRRVSSLSLAVGLAVIGAACGDGGDGRIVVDAFALEEARTGIPATATADGFSARFDHVVLELEDFTAATRQGGDAGLVAEPVLVELVPDRAQVFAFDGVPAQRWNEVGFTTAPPPAGVRLANEIDPDLVERMVDEALSLFISGTITSPDGDEFPFELGFPVTARYFRCESGRDGTEGLVVPVNGIAEVEVTWHLTHLFFDSFAEDAALRLEPFAAVYDGVDPIDFDDLATQSLSDLRGLDGEPIFDDQGNPVLYIPPASGADTLRDFVLAARFGHFDGLEGFCTTDVSPPAAE